MHNRRLLTALYLQANQKCHSRVWNLFAVRVLTAFDANGTINSKCSFRQATFDAAVQQTQLSAKAAPKNTARLNKS